jgi:RecB family endonuclease NucS
MIIQNERELQLYLIKNFKSIFKLDYLDSEYVVENCRIDLIGGNLSAVYLIELKRDYITNAAVQQLSNYLSLYVTDKELFGIVAAPKIHPQFNFDLLPPNILVQPLDKFDIDFDVGYNQAPIRLEKDLHEALKVLAKKNRRSVSAEICILVEKALQDADIKVDG